MTPLVRICESLSPVPGRLTYESGDFSFLFVRAPSNNLRQTSGNSGVATLCYGRLEIDTHLPDGQWLGVTGLTNFQYWRLVQLTPPSSFHFCGLQTSEVGSAQSGVGYVVDHSRFETQLFDPRSGWYCTGDATMQTGVVVQFATNCFATLHDGVVTAIWLHPENWPSVIQAIS